MTPEQLEEGYCRAKREFASWRSILHRSLGLPGAWKRLAYNVAWMKIDPLWVAIIRSGMMPFATRIFQRVLRVHTRAGDRDDASLLRRIDMRAEQTTVRPSARIPCDATDSCVTIDGPLRELAIVPGPLAPLQDAASAAEGNSELSRLDSPATVE